MYRPVPKRTIRRLAENADDPALRAVITMLELCKEADDDLWRRLMLHHLHHLEMLDSPEGRRMKKEIRRKLKRGI